MTEKKFSANILHKREFSEAWKRKVLRHFQQQQQQKITDPVAIKQTIPSYHTEPCHHSHYLTNINFSCTSENFFFLSNLLKCMDPQLECRYYIF